MSIIVGTQTTRGRQRQAQSSIGTLAGYPLMSFAYFKIGEGGWMWDAGVKVPKSPNPGLTDIEADGSPGNTFVQKSLTTDKVEYIESLATSKVTCLLDLLEGNDNGYGEPPKYFEIGLFDAQGNMIIYATFPEETKNDAKVLTHVILAVW